MKKLLLILSFVMGLCFTAYTQSLSRSQLDQILFAATERVNVDLGKNYTVNDALSAYQNGYLTVIQEGRNTYRYSFSGCSGVILLIDF